MNKLVIAEYYGATQYVTDCNDKNEQNKTKKHSALTLDVM